MEQLQSISGVEIPAPLRGLREKAVLHRDVTEKDAMMQYVMEAVK
jgi:hypothetical protein